MFDESPRTVRRGWLYVSLTIVGVLGLWFAVITAVAVANGRVTPAIVCGILTVTQALLFTGYLRTVRQRPGR